MSANREEFEAMMAKMMIVVREDGRAEGRVEERARCVAVTEAMVEAGAMGHMGCIDAQDWAAQPESERAAYCRVVRHILTAAMEAK